MPRLTSRTRVVILLLLLAAWAWRLHGLDAQSLWRDEVDSLRFATRPLAQVLGNFLRPGENGPLFFLLLRPWLFLGGRSEFALRFPSALAGVLALPLVFAWGRRLFNLRVGLVAMLLLAVNPYHVWYSQEAKMYALLVAVVLMALWTFAEALERGSWWRWVLWFLFTTVCFYIHVLGVLVIPLQAAWLLLVPRWRRRWLPFATALAVLILPYLPLVWWQWALLTDPDFRTGHPFVPLPRMLLTLFVAQIQGIPQRPTVWLYTPTIFLLLAGIGLSRRWWRSRALLLLWWLLPPLGVFLVSLITPLFTDRYLIWILPAFVLLMSVGAILAGRESPWLAALLVFLALGFSLWQGWREKMEPLKSDFRSAAAYVAPRRRNDELTLFLIPYIRFTYRYYDPGPYPWADAPYANREPDASLVSARMEQITEGYASVWVVESEADFYDREGLIHAWLDQHGTLLEEAHFTRVDVYHYSLSPP